METFFYIYIFIIGTLFGSFSSVIIDRLKKHKPGIITGKSECPKCKQKLNALDLIPVFSFILRRGRCRYCGSKISLFYPILEISTGLLFITTSYFLVDINLILDGNLTEIYKIFFFIIFSFLTLVYVTYDILYLEIPDSILAILIGISLLTISLQSIFPGFQIVDTLPSYNASFSLGEIIYIISLGLLSTFGFYVIMLKGLKEIYDIAIVSTIICLAIITKFYFGINLEQTAIGSALLGSLAIFGFLFLQILLSGGTWIGGGDLRVGILVGLITGIHFSFYSIMASYILGSIVGILIIIQNKVKTHYKNKKTNITNKIKKLVGIEKRKKALDTKIAFGPFLAIGIYIVLFWGSHINELLKGYL